MAQHCIRCANGNDHWATAHNADQADPMDGKGLGAPEDPCETLATRSEKDPAFPLHEAVAWRH